VLAFHGRIPQGPLRLTEAQLGTLEALDDATLPRKVTQLVHWRRQSERRTRSETKRAEAAAAARELVRTAIWSSTGRVHLTPSLLLGPVLADPERPLISLCLGERAVPVLRSKLLATRRALKPFRDARAWLEPERLCIRWRDGQGGLNFRPQPVNPCDRARVLEITFEAPAPVPQPVPQPDVIVPRPDTVPTNNTTPSRGAWLAEVLADLLRELKPAHR
jgi:hypothetical protein